MKSLIYACSLIILLTALSTDASAQSFKAKDAKINKVEIEIQQTPQFQAGNVKDKKIPRPRDWVEVEVEFEISDKVIKGDFVEAVMLRYYIAVQGEDNAYVMTGDVTHVNVPTGEDVFSCVYLPPAVIDLAKGKDSKINTSDIRAVGVSIFVNGVELMRDSVGMNAGWWEAPSQAVSMPGVLPKSKTPFSLLWIDRHLDEQKTG